MYTDYMANPTIMYKDMAVSRLYLQPFKWSFIATERAKLGRADGLLKECLKSEFFWE